MADKKISALTASSVPLAGTEVLPIVQSGATVKVAVSDLTAGRTVSMSGGTVTSGGAIRMYRGDNAIYTDLYNTTGASGGFVLNNANGDGFSFQDGAVTQVKINNGNVVISTSGKGIDFSATAGTGTSELLADYEEGTWTPVDSSGAGLTFSGASGTYTKIGRQVTVNGQLTFPATASTANIAIGGLPFTVGTFSVGAVNNADVVFTITSSTVFYIYDVAGTRKTNVNYSGVTIYFTIAYFV
jgi:hypothetical protein